MSKVENEFKYYSNFSLIFMQYSGTNHYPLRRDTMPKIVRFHQTGAADVLKLEDMPLSEPDRGEVRLKVEAIGLNRAEVMFRQGQYLEDAVFPSRL